MNRYTSRLRMGAATLLLTLLCACILVDDFGAIWKKATPDPCLSKIAESLYYAEFRRDPAGKDITQLARGWSQDGFHYLLLKKNADDVGGRLYRFTVTNGIFQRYRLDPTARTSFEKSYPDAPVSLAHDTVTLKSLTQESMKLLTEIAGKADYWEIEDQTLYNTALNPFCRFDDRDLKTLDQ